MATKEKNVLIQKADVFCPRCNNVFERPKLLPCMHCVCLECQTKAPSGSLQSQCPTCGKPHTDSLKNLPDAHFKTEMVKLYKHIQAKDTSRCEECEETVSAINFVCSQCGFICDNCVKNHKTYRIYRKDHDLEKISGDSDTMSKQLVKLQDAETCRMKCHIHEDFVLSMYCKKCECLVCRECTGTHHKPPEHSCVLVTNTVATHKEELKKMLCSLQDHLTSIQSAIQQATASAELIGQQQTVIEKMLTTLFEEISKNMKVLECSLLQKLRKEVNTKTTQLKERECYLNKQVTEIEDLAKVTDEFMQHSTDQQLAAAKHHVIEHLKHTMTMDPEKQVNVEDSIVQPLSALLLSSEKRIVEICKSHLLQYYDLSLDKSEISDIPKQVEIGKETKFIVRLVSESMNPCFKKPNLTVNIILQQSGKQVNCDIAPGRHLGAYEVSLKPAKKGRHTISVKIEDKEVKGSPFTILVKPPSPELTIPCDVYSENVVCPWGTACAPNGKVYVTLNNNSKIVEFDKTTNNRKDLIAIRGHKQGQLWNPTGIAIDKEGFIYVADSARIQKIDSSGQFQAEYKRLSNPQGVMVNDTRVYVCDQSGDKGCIVILDKNLYFTGHKITDNIKFPNSICEDIEGNIYVTDSRSILVYTAEGNYVRSIEKPASAKSGIARGICIINDFLYVCNDNSVLIFSLRSKYIEVCGKYGKNEGNFHSPHSLAVDLDGFIYVCDFSNNRIQVF